MKSLKIAFVVDDSLDSNNGVQQTTIDLGKYLNSCGHEVYYLNSISNRKDIANIYSFSKVRKFKFNGNYVNIPAKIDVKKITSFLSEHTFDIVDIRAPYSPFLAGRIITSLPPPDQTKVVCSFHIAPLNLIVNLGIRLLRFINYKSIKRIDLFIANTTLMSDYYKKAWKISEIVTIPNPVNTDKFPAKIRPYHIEDKINLVFLGRLVHRKGCLELVKAVNDLNDELKSKIHLHIGGRGPLESRVKKMIREYELADVVSLYGFIKEEDKSKFLASGDLLIFPSKGGESFGNSVIEGMVNGHGIVLAGHNAGYSTLLNYHPQMMFKPKVKNLTNCLIHWLNQTKTDYQDALAWQQKRFRDNYDLNTIVGPKVIEEYFKLLSG